MRFTITKDISSHAYLRNILILTLLTFELFVLAYVYFQSHSIGYAPSAIESSILGNEELFVDPKSFILILEELHIGVFMYLMVATIVLMVFVQIRNFENMFFKVALFLMFTILVDTISMPLILLWDGFAYVKSLI